MHRYRPRANIRRNIICACAHNFMSNQPRRLPPNCLFLKPIQLHSMKLYSNNHSLSAGPLRFSPSLPCREGAVASFLHSRKIRNALDPRPVELRKKFTPRVLQLARLGKKTRRSWYLRRWTRGGDSRNERESVSGDVIKKTYFGWKKTPRVEE